MWSLLHEAKPARDMSSISPLWKQKRRLLSVSPSLLATQAQIFLLDYSTMLRTRHLATRVNTSTVERTFCLLYKPGDSGSKKKNNWAGFTPPFSLNLHVLFFCDHNLILIMNILNAGRRPCFLLLLWLLHSQPTKPAPGQPAALLLGHWQAGGGGGSFCSCKDPLALKARLGFQTVPTQPAFQDLSPTAHHTQSFSTLPPTKRCKLDNLPLNCKGKVYFNFPFQNLLSHCKLQVGLNKTFP